MFQQIIALIIILFFIVRLLMQRKKDLIGAAEFAFWLVFWILAMAVIASLKWIDALVAGLGFSGAGIEVMLYAAVAVIFYFIFKLRIRIERMERDITKIVREAAIRQENKQAKE